MFYWEGISYQLTTETFDGRLITRTYFTEEDLAKAIEVYGEQVISFKKTINGIYIPDKEASK